MDRTWHLVIIVMSVTLIAVVDLWTSTAFIGSILFTLPVALCALQRSKGRLWATVGIAATLTLIAGIWGFDRSVTADPWMATVDRSLVVASLLTLGIFIHLGIDRNEKHAFATKHVHQMEEQFRRLLESAPDAMVIADPNGIIQLVNAQSERIFGYAKEELLGQRVEMLIPSPVWARHEGHRAQFAKDPKFRMMGHGLELQGRRKNGSEFPVEISLSPLETEGGVLVSAAVRDISERKREQIAQQHLLAIMRSSNDAIISKDLNGIVTTWNAGAERLFGYTSEEMVGKPIALLFPPDRYEEEDAIDRGVMGRGGQVQHYETIRRRKDGSLVDVSLTISPIRNEKGEISGASKFAHDITDRKQKEQAIRRAEQRFRRLLESAPDAMVIVDAEGIMQLVNAQAETIFGYAKDELLGKPVELLIPSRFLGKHEGHRSQYAKDPKFRMMGHGLELQGRRKDGSEFPVEIALSPLETEGGLLVSAAVRDITDRKRAENEIHELNRTLEQRVRDRTDELLRSEKRYHNALDSLLEGVQIVGYDWTHLYVNDSLVAQSTYTREELIGYTMLERYPGVEHTEVFKVMQECMTDRKARAMETEFTFPNGRKTVFDLSIQPIAEGLFILSTDITDRKRSEEALAHQRAQLELQNQELEQFAYIASHDLQEPLRMVTSFMQLLERRYKDKLDPEADKFIGFAVDGAARMKQLISDLLLYSRLGRAAERTEVDMDAVYKGVIFDLAAQIAESAAVVRGVDLPHVMAARTEMVQLLQNLISNAIKFRRPEVAPHIHVDCHAEDGFWHFRVVDNGIGVAAQYRDKVFMPFKRLHDRSKYEGSGVGLAVAHKIVMRYNGRIWFEPTPDGGTTFHFTIKQ